MLLWRRVTFQRKSPIILFNFLNINLRSSKLLFQVFPCILQRSKWNCNGAIHQKLIGKSFAFWYGSFRWGGTRNRGPWFEPRNHIAELTKQTIKENPRGLDFAKSNLPHVTPYSILILLAGCKYNSCRNSIRQREQVHYKILWLYFDMETHPTHCVVLQKGIQPNKLTII